MVSNKLTYSLIFLGLLFHALESFVIQNSFIFLTAFAVTAATFVIAYFLWKLGVWAGGDVKVFTAIAAFNPFNLAFFPSLFGYDSIFSSSLLPIFPLTLFIFSIFSMLPFAALLSFKGIVKSSKLRNKVAFELRKTFFEILMFSSFIIGANFVVSFFNQSILWVFAFAVAYAFIPRKTKIFLSLVLIVFALYFDLVDALFSFILLFFPLLLIYLLLKLSSVARKYVLIEKKKISELKEGDISAENIVVSGGKVTRFEGIGIGTFFNYLKSNKIEEFFAKHSPKGKILASSRRAAGLEKEEIKELKKLVKEKKLSNSIKVKLSVPFIPAVFFAYVLLNLIGDLLWNLLL